MALSRTASVAEGGRPPPLAQRWLQAWPGVVAIVIALTLAAWSLNFGLPFEFRPDEDIMVGRAVGMALHGSLDPRFYNYPPLVFLVLAAAERLAQLAGAQTLVSAAGHDPSAAYLTARIVSTAAAGAAAAFTFAAARRAYGSAAAFVAALALAVAPLSVRQAHFGTTDEIQMALVAACLWASVSARTWRGYALAGLLAGLAAAAKYTGGTVLVAPLILAAFTPHRGRDWLSAIGFGGLGFAAPFLLTGRPGAYRHGLGFLLGNASGGGPGPVGIVFHLTTTLPFGLGVGNFAAALVGIGLALWLRRPLDLALLALVAVLLLLNATTHEVFFRYLLPAVPGFTILSGRWLASLPARRTALAVGVAGALLLPAAYQSVTTDWLLGRPDTRELAADWLDSHLAAGTGVRQSDYFSEIFYGPQDLTGNRLHRVYVSGDRLIDSFQQGLYTERFQIETAGGSVAILESTPPSQAPLPSAPPGSRTLAVFAPLTGAPAGVYDPGDAFFLPIWGFGGVSRPGPAIRIVLLAP